MKKNALVTLADENCIDQAKEVFSSVYWNAGWNGDYILLSNKIQDRDTLWFKNKGIIVKECGTPCQEDSPTPHPTALSKFCKFYLFTSYFKKWKNVIFLDADIIVRASLEELTLINGFAAVQCLPFPRLYEQLVHWKHIKKDTLANLKKSYALNSPAFNSGVLSFSTDIIKNETFSELNDLFKEYEEIGPNDQPILNFFFYKKWIRLPLIYNINPNHLINCCKIRPAYVKGAVLHFAGPKPWDTNSYFYEEWSRNLEKAELINLNKTQEPIKRWTKKEIARYSLYVHIKNIRHCLYRFSLPLLVILKTHFPNLFSKLKRLIG